MMVEGLREKLCRHEEGVAEMSAAEAGIHHHRE
jgi:hypothetical protein